MWGTNGLSARGARQSRPAKTARRESRFQRGRCQGGDGEWRGREQHRDSRAVATGDLIKATQMLGREYTILGVKSGEKLGRKLGFPTAN